MLHQSKPPKSSPWGKVDHVTEIIPGVWYLIEEKSPYDDWEVIESFTDRAEAYAALKQKRSGGVNA